jgi:hypothetical protein
VGRAGEHGRARDARGVRDARGSGGQARRAHGARVRVARAVRVLPRGRAVPDGARPRAPDARLRTDGADLLAAAGSPAADPPAGVRRGRGLRALAQHRRAGPAGARVLPRAGADDRRRGARVGRCAALVVPTRDGCDARADDAGRVVADRGDRGRDRAHPRRAARGCRAHGRGRDERPDRRRPRARVVRAGERGARRRGDRGGGRLRPATRGRPVHAARGRARSREAAPEAHGSVPGARERRPSDRRRRLITAED